jgi:LysM repeat protein
LIDNCDRVLVKQNEIKFFFPQKWEELNTLYQKTISVKPYSYKDLILVEDELKNYVQITSVYLLRVSQLNELRDNVKNKYKTLLDTPDKFETLSYSIVNDIAQFIIRADNAYGKGEFDISTHAYEKALNYLERQGIIVEIHNFDEKVRNYVKVYEIDSAFPGKYKVINNNILKSVELSRKGKFEEASEIIKYVKEDLKKLISERKRHIRYVEKYEEPGVEDFIIYTVMRGDTLAGISKKYYGSEGYSWKIWAWNHENYPNPDSIYPGDILKLFKTGDFKE